jgi:lipocalin
MKWVALLALLLSTAFIFGQSSQANSSTTDQSSNNGEVTVRGCVQKGDGDYVLLKQDPGMTYELATSGKTKLRNYLGQWVEVTGTKSPSSSTSSDATMPTGSPASVTLTVNSIRTISKECQSR